MTRRNEGTARATELVKIHQFPAVVNINVLTGKCPCKCVHCPVGQTPVSERADRFGGAEMDLALYKKVVDEIRQKSARTVLRVHSVGEPLFWTNIIDALGYSKHEGVRTWVFSCCLIGGEFPLKQLCENVDILEISVNSTNADDYLKSKGVDGFGVVFGNIRRLSEHIHYSHLSTRLIVSRVQTADPRADGEFVDFWRSTGFVDDAFVRSYHTYNDTLERSIHNKESISGADRTAHEACLVHWSRFNIHVDGRVFVCFNELFRRKLREDLVLGDLRDSSIQDIWRGERLQMIREAALSNDYASVTWCNQLPCVTCKHCQPLFGKQQTSEHQIMHLLKDV